MCLRKNNRSNGFGAPVYFYDDGTPGKAFFNYWVPFSDGKRYLDYGSRVTAGGRITNTNTLNNNSVVHTTYSNGST